MSTNTVWIIDGRCRIVGSALLDEDPKGACVIENRGERWIGPREALVRRGSQLRFDDGLDGNPAQRRISALVRHLTDSLADEGG